MSTPRLAYKPSEVADAFGCSRQHVYNLVSSGQIPSFLFGASRLIPASAVEALLAGTADQEARNAEVAGGTVSR